LKFRLFTAFAVQKSEMILRSVRIRESKIKGKNSRSIVFKNLKNLFHNF